MYNVIFDLDGTLWDATDVVAAAFNAYFKENYRQNYPISSQRLKGLFGKTMSHIASLLFPDETKERQTELMEGCVQSEHIFLEKMPIPLYPLVEETLEALKRKGCRLFIVSNSQAGYIELFLRVKGLGSYFEGHLCYGDTLQPKAHNIRKLIEEYGVENPIYVGDTEGDRQAASEAGVPFIFAAYGYDEDVEATYRIDTASQLLEII